MEPTCTEILISNFNGLSSRLQNLMISKDLCDVQLQVGRHRFDAHKLILCASSDVFRTMLTNQKWTEAHKQSIVLVEEPFCESVFGRFMQYIYSGQLYISHSTVCPLLTLADKYNVREMIPLCRSYMMENLDAPLNSSCVLQWWEIANMRNDAELEATILEYIECNFNKVIQTPDFLNASLDTVEKLLASSKLAVHNEAIIFYGVMLWLQTYMDFHHPPVSKVQEVFGRLTRHIRWPMMTENELSCLRDCADVQRFLELYESFIVLPNLSTDLDSHTILSNKDRVPSPAEVEVPCTSSRTDCIAHKTLFTDISSVSDNVTALLASNIGQQSLSSSISQQNLSSSSVSQQSLSSGVSQQSLSSSVSQQSLSLAPKEEKHYPTSKNCSENEQYSRNVYMPRVYISDYWCTSLTVSNFLAFPQYAAQTFFFSTPRTGYRQDDGHMLDWEVELCPKGVHFPPAILIGLERDGNKLVDESYVHTVRLSVMSRSPQELPLKVEVNVLVRANSLSEPGCSFVERCHRRTCIFDSKYQRHNLDDIVPYEKFGTYLRPDGFIPELHLTPTVAFTVSIVIRPLPFHYTK